MLAEYEATTKELLARPRAESFHPPRALLPGLDGEDLSYAFVAPAADFTQLGILYAGFSALEEAVGGEKWSDLMRRNGAAMDHYHEWVLIELPDASYQPAEPRLQPADESYLELGF